ncbi:MAG: radical SAM family heme chaperone HemW [Acidobacteria bacterium]|nr:radical SAM family heme chaperone HemW [Acidobacteriota bacterium]
MENNYQRRRVGIGHYPWAIHDIDHKEMAKLTRLDQDINRSRLLYIHIPFCDQICSFCPYPKVFNEHSIRENYLVALATELELYGSHFNYAHNPVEAVYIGGGTPSSLTVTEIGFIFERIRQFFNLEHVKEITFEANPASLSLEKLKLLNDLGVNRLSIGVQTFNSQYARDIGLLQSPLDSRQAVENTYKVGISKLSIDLMYNLPGQTPAGWEADVELTRELGIGHVTLYPLKIIPMLGLAKRIQEKVIPQCGDLSQEIDFFLRACQILESSGYNLETTYDLALPGQSHHYAREHFVEHLDLTATGLGAFGEINGYTYSNTNNIHNYIKLLKENEFPVQKGYQVQPGELPGKVMSMGLRFLEVSTAEFRERFQKYPQDIFSAEIENLTSRGLLEVQGDKIALTRMDGVTWGNNAALEFCDKFFRDNYPL